MWKRSACCAFFYFWNISVADLNNTFSQLNGLAGTNVVFLLLLANVMYLFWLFNLMNHLQQIEETKIT